MSYKISYKLIHCIEHTDRETHIDNLRASFNHEIQIFKGTYLKNISEKDIIPEYLKINYPEITFNWFDFHTIGEIGCYLSHYNVIKEVMDNTDMADDYTVIFEDDVDFDGKVLHEEINNIIKKINNNDIDFDVISLGNMRKITGKVLFDNIYNINMYTIIHGAHALLIKNKNAGKIYNCISHVTTAIDGKYTKSIAQGELNGFYIYPNLCSQKSGFESSTCLVM